MLEEDGPTIVFLAQPVNTTLDLSESATDTVTFTVDISGVTEASASYQWQVSTDTGANWASVSTGTGGTTASYTIAQQTDTSLTGAQFRCVVTSSGAANSPATSAVATLTVQA
jgi:hypothetical protein